MTAWHHSTIASPKKPPGKLRQSSPKPVPPPHRLAPPLRGFFPPFSGANQSLKEANPSLQVTDNKCFGLEFTKSSAPQAILVLTRHLTPALSPNSRWRRGRNARRLTREPATGLVGWSLANQKPPNNCSLSRRTGEGQGEGNSILRPATNKTKQQHNTETKI
jgi:hypothetical protein